MSGPTFGVDLHPGYQASFDFEEAAGQGYRFAFLKTSQGGAYVPYGFSAYLKRCEAHMLTGFYHFLERGASGRAQAWHFMDTVRANGGAKDRLLAVDFEDYGNRDPSNAQLESFISEVKAQTSGHPVVIYSTVGFWNGGTSSGDFGRYNADAAWEARVWYDEERREKPQGFYTSRWLPWYQEQSPRGLGGQSAKFLQFTWGGHVGGLYVDTNVFRGSMDELRKLT